MLVLLVAVSRGRSNVLAAVTPVVALIGFMAGSLVCVKLLLRIGIPQGPLVELVGHDPVRNSRRTRSAIAALAAIATVPASISVITSADDRRISLLPDNLPKNMVLLLSESMAIEGEATANKTSLEKLARAKQGVLDRLPGAETVEVFVAVKGSAADGLDPIRVSRPIPGRKAAFSEEIAWVESPALRSFSSLPSRSGQADAISNTDSRVAIDGWNLQRDNSVLPEPTSIPQNLSIAATWITPEVVEKRIGRPCLLACWSAPRLRLRVL